MRESMASTPLLRALDAAPWRPIHTKLTLALGIAWLLDAFEVTIIGSILPTIAGQWELSHIQQVAVVAIWLMGILVGAQGAGILADRFGRRRLFLITLVFYATFTLLSAFSVNYEMLMVLRFLTAIGVGAEYSAINAAISESIPARYRGRANAAVMSAWGLGALLAAGLSGIVIGAFPVEIGWRVGFGLGAVMALMAIFARRALPESPRWLLRRGRTDEARKVVEELTGVTVSGAEPAVPPAPDASLANLFRTAPRQAALGGALDFAEAAGYYGLFAFFAVLVTEAAGIPSGEVPGYYLWGGVGALAGGMLVAAFMDKLPRALTVTTTYLSSAVSLLVLAAATASGNLQWVLWAFILANFTATAAWVSAYPTFTELFPTPLRSTGVGFSVSVGRIGAAIAAIGLAEVASAFNLTTAFALLAGFWILGAVAMQLWARNRGLEGARVPLERLDPTLERGPA